MGLVDALWGRTKPVPADLDALFALPTAAITLEAAVGSANNASRSAGTGLVRPSSASNSPIADRLASAGAGGQSAELVQPLLQRGVGGEQRRQAHALRQRGGEEERVERFGRPQVAGRHPRHVAGDLDQGGGQRRRPTGQLSSAAVRRQLPVARERPDEQE